jgi:two-component sensor histidine kinase
MYRVEGFFRQTTRWFRQREDQTAFRYGVAVAFFGLALLVRFVSDNALPTGFPFLTFFPAVMLTAWMVGLWPGVFCTVLSALAAWFFFIPPAFSFNVSAPGLVALAFFIIVAGVDIAVIHGMRLAQEKLSAERNTNAALAVHQKTLYAELQHRIANNLAFVANMLSLQSKKLEGNSEATDALIDARRRLETLSHIHRKLYDPDNVNLPLRTLLRDIADGVLHTSDGRIGLEVEVPDVTLPADQVMTLSMFLMEVLTNSLKHAFSSGRGTVTIRLDERPADVFVLSISDDGPGLPSGFDLTASKSLGMRILHSFARTLNGDVAFNSDGGLTTCLTFTRDT